MAQAPACPAVLLLRRIIIIDYNKLRRSLPLPSLEAPPLMYVCLCNAFTDRQVRAVCPDAGSSAAAVYCALGVRPVCGKCVPMVREILAEVANTITPDAISA
jgi:bacterioferritin-associated ferredoxin